MQDKYKKGISLYLAIGVMSVLLSMVLGMSAILARQFKIIAGMEDSVIALYAADTGIERALVDVIKNRSTPSVSYSATLTNQASYQVSAVCCGAGANCVYIGAAPLPCPAGLAISPSCSAVYYCIKSRGYFGPPSDRTKTQRAIQVAL